MSVPGAVADGAGRLPGKLLGLGDTRLKFGSLRSHRLALQAGGAVMASSAGCSRGTA